MPSLFHVFRNLRLLNAKLLFWFATTYGLIFTSNPYDETPTPTLGVPRIPSSLLYRTPVCMTHSLQRPMPEKFLRFTDRKLRTSACAFTNDSTVVQVRMQRSG